MRKVFVAGALALALAGVPLAAYRAQTGVSEAPTTPPLLPPERPEPPRPLTKSEPVPPSRPMNVPVPPPPPASGGLSASAAPAPPATTPAPIAGLVGELAGILNETKSKETFSVTLAVLRKMGPEAKPAVPVILRNADRLGLFDGAVVPNGQARQAATEVLTAIDAILGRSEASPVPTAPVQVGGVAGPTCAAPWAPQR
jgi:hypothetical protein